MELYDYYEILGSNFKQDRNELLKNILENFDPSRFDLMILNEIFKSFLSSKPKLIKDIKKSDFEKFIPDIQYKSNVIFKNLGKTWTGTVISHKWFNNQDEREWFTYSIKLPNDGYFYNQSYRASKGDYLKEKSFHKFEDIFNFVFEFFGKNDFKIQVLYLTSRNRVNIKAMCPELCVWLQITFENGYPDEEITEWCTKDKLLQILEIKK
jgi:hypothetical protein